MCCVLACQGFAAILRSIQILTVSSHSGRLYGNLGYALENMATPFQLNQSSLTKAVNAKKGKIYTEAECLSLVSKSDKVIQSVQNDLTEARELCTRCGLPVESDLSRMLRQKYNDNGFSDALTAGHSNTNHILTWTGDYETDRISELRRNLMARARTQQPEAKGEDRWDKPRASGERRRRITRSKDLPGAPPEPPPSGYVVFLGQMTTKWRHDRPNEPHNQTRVVQEISKIWKVVLTDDERKYYYDFIDEAREEYKKQHMEFRATGHFTPSEKFQRIEGAGLWIRRQMEHKNALEREIAQYETVTFPPRPPELDEEYKKREKERIERRKQKLKQDMEEKRKKTGQPARRRRQRQKRPKTDMDTIQVPK